MGPVDHVLFHGIGAVLILRVGQRLLLMGLLIFTEGMKAIIGSCAVIIPDQSGIGIIHRDAGCFLPTDIVDRGTAGTT